MVAFFVDTAALPFPASVFLGALALVPTAAFLAGALLVADFEGGLEFWRRQRQLSLPGTSDPSYLFRSPRCLDLGS